MKLISDASKDKLRGGFYTPEPIADFILKWAFNGGSGFNLLEPSCGDGVFLEEVKKGKFKYKTITAIELDKEEAQKTRNLRIPNAKVLSRDFFNYCNNTKQRFDLIVGNPPYIRYQFFDKEQRKEAQKIFDNVGLKYSKLTNPWVSFVVGSSLLLKEKGKIGFVLPAELLQVSYAKQLRNYLAQIFNKINIISFKKLVFPGIQQEVLLLLCEKTGGDDHRIDHIEVENAKELKKLDVARLRSPQKKIDFNANKWTFYFLDQEEINFINKHIEQKKILPLRNYATAEVGMTTGGNKFFTVPLETVEQYNLYDYVKPMVGRSVQVSSVFFTKKDWKSNVSLGARAHFLLFPKMSGLKKNKKALEYIKLGEEEGVSAGYKCRIRDEWQIVPSAWVSDALFIRRNNIYPKFIINKTGAYTTDTMHRVKKKNGVNIKALTASYYNSLSFAFAEISGRSHGGGVLELMPNEVQNILIPYNPANAAIINDIDCMLRDKKCIDDILKFTDEFILEKGCGFSPDDVAMANRIWKKLLKRRLGRNGR